MQENALTRNNSNSMLYRGDKMKLKELRKKHNYTQVQVAVICGVSLFTVQTWERGCGKPTGERREKLINLFKEHGETYEE
jgi:DNA-binding transcriptional regulator YiaG